MSLKISFAEGNIMTGEICCLKRKNGFEGSYQQGLINRQILFAIDSMPLEISKISREQRNTMGKKSAHHSHDKGHYASQKNTFMVTSCTVFVLHKE